MVFFTQSNEKPFKISSDSCFKSNLKNGKKLDFSIKTTAESILLGRFYRSWNIVVSSYFIISFYKSCPIQKSYTTYVLKKNYCKWKTKKKDSM